MQHLLSDGLSYESEPTAGDTMRVLLSEGLRDESGPTAVEYAVILALVVAVMMGAIRTVGGTTSTIWSNNASDIIQAIANP